MTVNAPVGAPNVIDDFARVTTGETTTIAVRSNDLGIWRTSSIHKPTNGVSSCPALNGAPGTCSYVPNPSFFTGPDSFTYTIDGRSPRSRTS